MSIFFIGIPVAIIDAICEFIYEKATKPRAVRGGYTFR